MAITYMTEEGYKKLMEEIAYLENVKRPEISRAIGEARDKGDLSENAEYDLARDEQAKMEREISDLENRLHNAEVITSENMSTETIGVGNTVTFKLNGKDEKYQIVGSQDSDPENNKISNESPIGKALIGHRAGDKFDVRIKTGKSESIKKIEIIGIEA